MLCHSRTNEDENKVDVQQCIAGIMFMPVHCWSDTVRGHQTPHCLQWLASEQVLIGTIHKHFWGLMQKGPLENFDPRKWGLEKKIRATVFSEA